MDKNVSNTSEKSEPKLVTVCVVVTILILIMAPVLFEVFK